MMGLRFIQSKAHQFKRNVGTQTKKIWSKLSDLPSSVQLLLTTSLVVLTFLGADKLVSGPRLVTHSLRPKILHTSNENQDSNPAPQPETQDQTPKSLPLFADDSWTNYYLFTKDNALLALHRDTDRVTLVEESPQPIWFVDMSPDGNDMYFAKDFDVTTVLYKKALPEGSVQEILSFNSSNKPGSISIDFNRNRVAYAHDHGQISLFDINTKQTSRLLTRKDCAEGENPYLDCYGYYKPSWTSDNQDIVVFRGYYEGSSMHLLNLDSKVILDFDILGASGYYLTEGSSDLFVPDFGGDRLYQVSISNGELVKRKIFDTEHTDLSVSGLYNYAVHSNQNTLYVGGFDGIFSYSLVTKELTQIYPKHINNIYDWFEQDKRLIINDAHNELQIFDIDTQSMTSFDSLIEASKIESL